MLSNLHRPLPSGETPEKYDPGIGQNIASLLAENCKGKQKESKTHFPYESAKCNLFTKPGNEKWKFGDCH